MLARKYALAFAHSFSTEFTLDDIQKLARAHEFFAGNSRFTFLLNLAALTPEQKKNALKEILIDQFQLPRQPFYALIDLLIAHRRGVLITPILKYLHEMIMEEQGIVSFTVESAYPLSDEQQREVKNFLAHETGKTIIDTYIVNKDLIAGLRVQSAGYLWEHSIKKYLRNFTRTFTQ